MRQRTGDITGKSFGRLKVISYHSSIQYGSSKKKNWRCICTCGNEVLVNTGALTSGNTKSCGCLHSEISVTNSINSRHKLAKKNSGYTTIYNRYICNARDRNLEFSLSKIEFIELLNSNCYYCNIEPSAIYDKNYYNIKYNGVDRIDNNIGYTTSNVVACCKFCNIAKNNNSLDDFLSWINRLIDNHTNLKKIQNASQRFTDSKETN